MDAARPLRGSSPPDQDRRSQAMNPKLTGVLLTMTLAALTACGGDDKKNPAPKAGDGSSAKGGAPAAAPGGAAYDAAKSTASVKVTVKWIGAKLEGPKIPMAGADQYCTGIGSADDPRFEIGR